MDSLLKYINEDRNLLKIFIFIAVFISITKIPSIIEADMQPWDEGLYATRVLSIHINGDFWDQAQHSVGKFYSASHPPLLIWIGYLVTLIGGVNTIALKLIPFVSSLFCIYFILAFGKKLGSLRNGVITALIFSSNIIFSVFSQRFQFDIPYLLLVLMSFYIFLSFIDDGKKYKIYLLGLIFGLSLMIKILVGFFIPIIIFLYFITYRKKINFTLINFIVFVSIGIIIALPWHLYMIVAHGKDFLDYFFIYHIFDRAFFGVEQNIKNSGPLYYLNYFLSILPYGFLIFLSMFEDFKNRKTLEKFDIFLYIWFFTGLLIITLFKTKLESYTFFILIPSSFIIARNILKFQNYSFTSKLISYIILILNILWVLSYPDRSYYLNYILHNQGNSIFYLPFALLLSSILLILISKKWNYSYMLYILIFAYFLSINFYYLFNIPVWENNYQLSEGKRLIDRSGKTDICYVGNIGTDYKYNAQFSFYFQGIDLGWKNNRYNYILCDTKYGTDSIKKTLMSVNQYKCTIIIENDNINRDEYANPDLFIPDSFELVMKINGYEIYQKF